MQRNILERIVADQIENFKSKPCGIERKIDPVKVIKSKQITVITGIRRSGKSTLLTQLGGKFESYYYLNFDDERLLKFSVDDFDDLLLIWKKLYKADVIFLDEVQNVDNWERFVRRIYDEGFKVFVTGSNAKLLSGELSTHLTGRYIKIELFPFSFDEYLSLRKFDPSSIMTTEKLAKLLRLTDEYIEHGGFPEYLVFKDHEYLKRIYEDILYKDLIVRFKIRDVKSFRELANYLFTNFTSEISYNNLQKYLNFKSVASVKNFIGFIQESYLISELYKYDHSLKKQVTYNKKIYVIDNGLRNEVSFRTSSDSGKLLENLIFIQLKRKASELYFFKGKKECDFLIKYKNRIVSAIQVTDYLNEKNKDREFAGLVEAMTTFNLKKGTIITRSQEDDFVSEGRRISVVPIHNWLLNDIGKLRLNK